VSWIKTITDAQADAHLSATFAANADPASGKLDNIMRIHSLHPSGLDAHVALYSAVMRGTKSLRKVEREMIALVVSGINECHY
jgi:alkylhydroperoxidase family enzyme